MPRTKWYAIGADNMTEKTLDKMTDEELVALAQAGDKTAEEKILFRHGNLVRAYARKFFLANGETEDLLQEGMIGLYQAIGKYKTGSGSFKTFAGVCIYRRIVDAVKNGASKKHAPLNNSVPFADLPLLYADSDPEQTVICDDDRRRLNKMMSRELTDIEFKVFTMYLDGASCLEICETTGKSQKSVDNAIQRSKRKLIKALEKENK